MSVILRLLCASALVLGMEGQAAAAKSGERDAALVQGWSDDLREAFYFSPQGSHLVPYDWALALEVADGEGLFFAPENIQTFGYLQAPASGRNPDRLPSASPASPPPDPRSATGSG